MGSRRGNFIVPQQHSLNGENLALDSAEAEWAGQWEPTVAQIYGAPVQGEEIDTDARAEVEVVISIHVQGALAIRLVA